MPYLVDGHNLIPKMGLRLDSLDDERELIAILQEYCRLERKQVEVYFDGAPIPHAGQRKFGAVTAHFVPQSTTADEAIQKRLKRMGKTAKNWSVVSSDRRVQAEARAAQAEFIPSETFASSLKRARNTAPKSSEHRTMSDGEMDEWLRLFNQKRES